MLRRRRLVMLCCAFSAGVTLNYTPNEALLELESSSGLPHVLFWPEVTPRRCLLGFMGHSKLKEKQAKQQAFSMCPAGITVCREHEQEKAAAKQASAAQV